VQSSRPSGRHNHLIGGSFRIPKPFFRKQTRAWYVQLGKKQHNLGPDEEAAKEKYHVLMAGRQPVTDVTTVVDIRLPYGGQADVDAVEDEIAGVSDVRAAVDLVAEVELFGSQGDVIDEEYVVTGVDAERGA